MVLVCVCVCVHTIQVDSYKDLTLSALSVLPHYSLGSTARDMSSAEDPVLEPNSGECSLELESEGVGLCELLNVPTNDSVSSLCVWYYSAW